MDHSPSQGSFSPLKGRQWSPRIMNSQVKSSPTVVGTLVDTTRFTSLTVALLRVPSQSFWSLKVGSLKGRSRYTPVAAEELVVAGMLKGNNRARFSCRCCKSHVSGFVVYGGWSSFSLSLRLEAGFWGSPHRVLPSPAFGCGPTSTRLTAC